MSTPINIKIIPPTISAFFSYLSPNTFPILTPIAEIINVIIPIILIAKKRKGGRSMSDEANKIIGKKLYTARKRKKLSRAKIAELMGIHETTVKRYEDGEVKSLDVEKLKDFSKILNIPLDLLIDVIDGSYILEDTSEDKNTFTLRLYDEVNFLENISLKERTIELDSKFPNDKFQFIVSQDNEIIELRYRAELVNPYFSVGQDIEFCGIRIQDDSIDKVALPRMYAVVEIFGNIGDEEVLKNGNLIMTIDKNNVVIFRHYSKHGDTIVLTPNSNNKTIQPIVFFGEEIKKFRLLGRVWGFITPIEEYSSEIK